MNDFSNKDLKVCFAILSPECSLNLIRDTVNSIKYHYPKLSFISVTDSSATKEDLSEIKKICPVYKGNDTISSLINVAMRHSTSDWVFLIMSGTNVRPKLDTKFSFYISTDKDILYPVADYKYNFIDATLNGLFINRKTFKEIGDMQESGPLDIVKTIWAAEALHHGCKFKAIVGSKMC